MNKKFEKLGFYPADILLPKDQDMRKWAVVACDQFTSQPEYWQAVEDTVGDAPSALRLILPEAQLNAPDVDERIAAINGTMERYLDGGVADSIPVRRAYEDGWHKQVVVLTQNEGYVKKPNQMMPLIRRRYRDYPNLCRAMENRHLNYNESQQFAKELEQKGQAVVIRPSKPMVLHRIEHNVDKLQAAYENGYEDAKAVWSRIEQLFQQQ